MVVRVIVDSPEMLIIVDTLGTTVVVAATEVRVAGAEVILTFSPPDAIEEAVVDHTTQPVELLVKEAARGVELVADTLVVFQSAQEVWFAILEVVDNEDETLVVVASTVVVPAVVVELSLVVEDNSVVEVVAEVVDVVSDVVVEVASGVVDELSPDVVVVLVASEVVELVVVVVEADGDSEDVVVVVVDRTSLVVVLWIAVVVVVI